MATHIHAALMAEYAKDAAETDKPWQRWEVFVDSLKEWKPCVSNPRWLYDTSYRRKRTPLCQVEGKDVFPGDKLWHTRELRWMVAKDMDGPNTIVTGCGYFAATCYLSWTEPVRTKTVYQWAWKARAKSNWVQSRSFAESEAEWRKIARMEACDVRRLDYTALEVPA